MHPPVARTPPAPRAARRRGHPKRRVPRKTGEARSKKRGRQRLAWGREAAMGAGAAAMSFFPPTACSDFLGQQ
eukprot:gene25489-biopygen10510